jgi:hypothetical protein
VTDSIQQTLASRESTHGGFRNNSRPTQNLKDIARAHPGWDGLPEYKREAFDMIFHKMGRILAISMRGGDDKDAWHDVAGYATLCELEGVFQPEVTEMSNVQD